MITSPCIGVCTYDPGTGWCEGCGRTQSEIGGWGGAPEAARAAVWAALPARLDQLGASLRRPDWSEADIAAFARDTLREGHGAWTVGVHGAVAAVSLSDAGASAEGGAVTARGADGALRLRLPRAVQALESLGPDGTRRMVALVLHRFRLPPPPPSGLREVGPDSDAIDAEARDETLFDLGLGMPAARFMLRTANPALIYLLRGLAGMAIPALLREAGAALVHASPVRVVESASARAEVTAPIPGPDGTTPEGCHTHLLPGALALGRETPPELALPPDYAPVAIWHAPGVTAESDHPCSLPPPRLS